MGTESWGGPFGALKESVLENGDALHGGSEEEGSSESDPGHVKDDENGVWNAVDELQPSFVSCDVGIENGGECVYYEEGSHPS